MSSDVKKIAHRKRVLAHLTKQQRAALKELAGAERKPPKKVTP